MPTYLYECQKCEKTFEVEQRITEPTLTDCDCGATGTLKRLIQPTAIVFKGSGFHINDYANNRPTQAVESKPEKGEACLGEPATCGRCSESSE